MIDDGAGFLLARSRVEDHVACSAFSLVYKLGFSRIILVGQDLALTGNKTHADGTFKRCHG